MSHDAAASDRRARPPVQGEREIAVRLRLLGTQAPHAIEELDRHVELVDLRQPMREHPQQPCVLELQLRNAGEHADPKIALAVFDQVVGTIKIEGRTRAVGIALGQIPAVRIARGRTQRSQIRRVGIPRLDRDAQAGCIGRCAASAGGDRRRRHRVAHSAMRPRGLATPRHGRDGRRTAGGGGGATPSATPPRAAPGERSRSASFGSSKRKSRGIAEVARPPRHAVLPHRDDASRLVALTCGLRHTLLVLSLEERGPQFRRGDGRGDIVLEVLLERFEHEQRRAGRDDREALPKPDEIIVVRLGVDAERRQTLLRPQLLDEAGRLR